MATWITAKAFGTIAGAAVLAGTIAVAAFGVVGGTADGDAHPYVGAAELAVNGGVELCSGSLVSPTRFVTAAHCFPQLARVEVSFDENPNPLAGALRFTGTVFNDPNWQLGSGGVPTSDTHDVAVILLDGAGAPQARYAQLPDLSQPVPLSNNQLIDVVGYGVRSFKPPLHGTRQLGVLKLTNGGGKIGDEYLKLSANQSQDKAAACEGDSGGPDLLHRSDVMIGITSFSVDANCSGVAYSERIDRQSTIDFINGAGAG